MSRCGDQMQKRAAQRTDAGVTLVFMTMLIGVLVLVCGASVSVGYSLLAAIQAQAVADSMALAASQALCSTNQCWQNARVAAAEVLSHSTIVNSIGQDSSLPNINTGDYKTTELVNWSPSASNLDITIERGQWLPNEPADSRFISFEANNQTNSRFDFTSTGLPAYTVANAVRVKVTRQELAPVFSLLRDALHVQPSGEALAVTGGTTLQELPTAPIAIPLCSLLDWDAQYDPNPSNNDYPYMGDLNRRYRRSETDLLVTRADWDCPIGGSDPRCADMASYGLMPAFLSQPISDTAAFLFEEWECGGRDPDIFPMCAFAPDTALHFHTRWHPKTSMNYAVYLGGDEAEVRDRLLDSGSGGFLRSTLGSPVTDGVNPVGILPDGLTTIESRDAFRARMRNPISLFGQLPLGGEDSGAFQSYTPIRTAEIGPEREGISGLFEVNGPGSGQLAEVPFWVAPAVSRSTVRASDQLDPMHPLGFSAVRGVCPSEIVPDIADASYRNLNTWRVLVPVIYDHQTHCMNLSDSRGDNDSDVQPDPSHLWSTVGYVHVTFYDATIGEHFDSTTVGGGQYSTGTYFDDNGAAEPYRFATSHVDASALILVS